MSGLIWWTKPDIWHVLNFPYSPLSVSVWFFHISCFNQCSWVIVSAFCIPTRITQHHDSADCTAYQAASPEIDPLIIIMMIVNFYSALNTHGKSMLLVDTGVYLLIQDTQTFRREKKRRETEQTRVTRQQHTGDSHNHLSFEKNMF